MGRLSDLFDLHRDNVEEGVKKALGRADDSLEALRKRLEEVEAKLREIAGEAPISREDTTSSAVTSQQTGRTTESVKQPRSKK